MSARSYPQTQDGLVDHLRATGVLQNAAVEAVMRRVDRAQYTGIDPYADCAQDIGFNAQISSPHLHAIALQHLEHALRMGTSRTALDVGAGSGYVTSCMALLQGDHLRGVVVGVEHIPEIAAQAEENIRHDQPELLDSGRVRIVVGDGRLGYPGEAPFDAIHVGAAVDKEYGELTSQLAPGGCMVVPVGTGTSMQRLTVVKREVDGHVRRSRKAGVSFMPLSDAEDQWGPSDYGRRRATPPPRRSHLTAIDLTEEDVEVLVSRVEGDQRHSSTNQRHSSADQRHSSTDQRYSSADQRHSSADQRHSSADQRHSSTDQRYSSADQRHSSADQRHSSADQRHSSADL